MAFQRVVDGGCRLVLCLLGRSVDAELAAGVDELAGLECFLNIFELAAVQKPTCLDVVTVLAEFLDQAFGFAFFVLHRVVAATGV